MKVPRDLSGEDLVTALCRNWGYVRVHQEGSHIVLETSQPSHQRIAIPAHQVLRVGTLNSILRAVATHKGVTRQALVQSLAS
jgi:predicted RNA binding protein YcfA (HicA-like mRNA interferase family)